MFLHSSVISLEKKKENLPKEGGWKRDFQLLVQPSPGCKRCREQNPPLAYCNVHKWIFDDYLRNASNGKSDIVHEKGAYVETWFKYKVNRRGRERK